MATAAGKVDGPTLGIFYKWLLAWSQPMRGDITYAMSSYVTDYTCSLRH